MPKNKHSSKKEKKQKKEKKKKSSRINKKEGNIYEISKNNITITPEGRPLGIVIDSTENSIQSDPQNNLLSKIV